MVSWLFYELTAVTNKITLNLTYWMRSICQRLSADAKAWLASPAGIAFDSSSPLEVKCRPNFPQLESAHPVVRELYKMEVFEATFKEFLPRRGKIDWESLVDDSPEETLNDTKMARIMKLYARYLLALEIYFCRRCMRYPYLYSDERPRRDAAALKACLEDLDAIMSRRYPDRDEMELPLMED